MLDQHFNAETMQRAITCVTRRDRPSAPMSVNRLLDPLDAEKLALLRFTPHMCGHCGAPVNLRVRAVEHSGTTTGRRAYFAHAAGTGNGCPAQTSPAIAAASIGAHQFDGRQEGARHRYLKQALMDAACGDSHIDDAMLEVLVTNEGAYRRPDVAMVIDGRMVGIDLQLAPPSRDTIRGRTAFYERSPVLHAWVLDAAQLDQVNLQPFQDLLWRLGGNILAFDEACVARSTALGHLQMKRVSITDSGRDIGAQWSWITWPELRAWFGLTPAPTGLAGDPISRAFWAHLASPERTDLKLWYDAMAPDLGLPPWKDFVADGLRPVLGALASILSGRVRDGSMREPDAVRAVVNTSLATDVFDGRHLWVPLIESALRAVPTATMGGKMPLVLGRAWAAHDPREFACRIGNWRPLFARFLPALPLP